MGAALLRTAETPALPDTAPQRTGANSREGVGEVAVRWWWSTGYRMSKRDPNRRNCRPRPTTDRASLPRLPSHRRGRTHQLRMCPTMRTMSLRGMRMGESLRSLAEGGASLSCPSLFPLPLLFALSHGMHKPGGAKVRFVVIFRELQPWNGMMDGRMNRNV